MSRDNRHSRVSTSPTKIPSEEFPSPIKAFKGAGSQSTDFRPQSDRDAINSDAHRMALDVSKLAASEILSKGFARDEQVQAKKLLTLAKDDKPRKTIHLPDTMDDHKLTLQQILHRYDTKIDMTSPWLSQGLNAGDVTLRQSQYGPNRLTPPSTSPWYFKFLECVLNMFNILLFAGGIG